MVKRKFSDDVVFHFNAKLFNKINISRSFHASDLRFKISRHRSEIIALVKFIFIADFFSKNLLISLLCCLLKNIYTQICLSSYFCFFICGNHHQLVSSQAMMRQHWSAFWKTVVLIENDNMHKKNNQEWSSQRLTGVADETLINTMKFAIYLQKLFSSAVTNVQK